MDLFCMFRIRHIFFDGLVSMKRIQLKYRIWIADILYPFSSVCIHDPKLDLIHVIHLCDSCFSVGLKFWWCWETGYNNLSIQTVTIFPCLFPSVIGQAHFDFALCVLFTLEPNIDSIRLLKEHRCFFLSGYIPCFVLLHKMPFIFANGFSQRLNHVPYTHGADRLPGCLCDTACGFTIGCLRDRRNHLLGHIHGDQSDSRYLKLFIQQIDKLLQAVLSDNLVNSTFVLNFAIHGLDGCFSLSFIPIGFFIPGLHEVIIVSLQEFLGIILCPFTYHPESILFKSLESQSGFI